MERDEVDAIRKFEDPGLFLIGFKPMEKLKIHHHIRPAVFLYPEEGEVKGSTVCLPVSYWLQTWQEESVDMFMIFCLECCLLLNMDAF